MSLLDWNSLDTKLEKEIAELDVSIPIQEEILKNEEFKLIHMQSSRRMKVDLLAHVRNNAQTAPTSSNTQTTPITPPPSTEAGTLKVGQLPEASAAAITSSSNKRHAEIDTCTSSANKSTKESAEGGPAKKSTPQQEGSPTPPLNTNTASANAGSSGRVLPHVKQFNEGGAWTTWLIDISGENSVRTQYVRAHPRPDGLILSSNEYGGLQTWNVDKSGTAPKLLLKGTCNTSAKVSLPPMFNQSVEYIVLANSEPQEKHGTVMTFVNTEKLAICKMKASDAHGALAPTAMTCMLPPAANSTECQCIMYCLRALSAV